MARQNATNFTGGLQFPYATAATDLFKKEDVQTLALAVDQHDHTTGKGLSVAPAAGSVTNVMLGPDVARDNLLTNGGFEIWQRGNGPFSVGVSQYTADRWKVDGSAGDTISVSRDTTNIDIAAGSGACAAVTFTKGSGATNLSQGQAPDLPSLVGRTVSLSIRVRTATANAVRVAVYNGAAWVYSAYHPGNGTYQTLTVAGVTLGAAGTFTGSAAVWFDATCTAYIDNACLVVGSQPANYVPLHPADDLARCLRYYETMGGSAAGVPQLYGYGAAGTQVSTTIAQHVRKAVTPTLTILGTWSVVNCAAPSVTGDLDQVVLYTPTVTATGAFQIRTADGTNKIVIEANP